MDAQIDPPAGWHRDSAVHRDRKYTSAVAIVFGCDDADRQIEVVPTLLTVPGDDIVWTVRERVEQQTRKLDRVTDRDGALAVALAAMDSD